jgi:hypothetical protein
MSKLSPRAVRALADAEAAGGAGRHGLARTVAGWCDADHPTAQYHHFATINALVRAGYLQLWAKGKVAHITDGGRMVLERHREQWRAA